MVLSEPSLQSCIRFSGPGEVERGRRAERIGEIDRRPRSACSPQLTRYLPSVAMRSRGLIDLSQAKIKRIKFLRQPAPVLPPESLKCAKALSPCLSASTFSLSHAGTARSRQRLSPLWTLTLVLQLTSAPVTCPWIRPICWLSAFILANCHPIPTSPAAPSRQGAECVCACACVPDWVRMWVVDEMPKYLDVCPSGILSVLPAFCMRLT